MIKQQVLIKTAKINNKITQIKLLKRNNNHNSSFYFAKILKGAAILKKVVKNIKKYSGHFYVAMSALMIGLYIIFHLNYLDDPRVTPPPPITGAEHAATGFADDWWFGVILIIAAIVMFIGINIDKPKLRTISISAIAGCYGAITVAFFIRGVYDYRFNLTWIFALLSLAFIRQVLSTRGGGHHFK